MVSIAAKRRLDAAVTAGYQCKHCAASDVAVSIKTALIFRCILWHGRCSRSVSHGPGSIIQLPIAATVPSESTCQSLFAVIKSEYIMNSQIDRQRSPRDQFQGGNRIIYTHDLDGGFTFLNRVGEQISGYSCEEACRMNIAELMPAEIAAHVHVPIVRDVSGRVGTVYEIDWIAKDGRRVPLEVSTEVVLRHGQPAEIQGIAVPSVIRSDAPANRSPYCLDPDFFFGT